MSIPCLAIDPSLTSTGWAIITDRGDGITEYDHGVITDRIRRNGRTKKLDGPARMAYLASRITQLAQRHHARLIVAEGIYVGGYPGATVTLARFRGALEVLIWAKTGLPYIEVAPKTIKAYGTGNGNADKDAMVAAARDHLGYRGTLRRPSDRTRVWSSDVADAMWLHALVADALGQGYAPDLPSPELRQKRRQAVATVIPLLPRDGVLTPPTNPHQES